MSRSDDRPNPRRLRAWYCLFFVWLLLSSLSGVAWSAPSVLVLVRAADQTDPTPYELRLRSELAAEGIVSVVVNPMSTPNETKQVAAKFGASATVEVTVSSSEITSVIWASDPSLNLEVTRSLRVSAKERDAVGVFALRTVDFLQGARIELEQQRQAKMPAASTPLTAPADAGVETLPATAPPTPPPVRAKSEAKPPAPVRPATEPPSARSPLPSRAEQPKREGARRHIRLAASYSLLVSSDQFDWATAPSLALAWYFHPQVALGVFGAGPYINHVNSESERYSIAVDQEYFGLDFRLRLLALPIHIEPHVASGVARYAADATVMGGPAEGVVGHHAKAWSLFSMGGLTLVWQVGPHFRLLGDVDALIKWQIPSVAADNAVVIDGSPSNLLLRLGPGWAF